MKQPLVLESELLEEIMADLSEHLFGVHRVAIVYDDTVVEFKGLALLAQLNGLIVVDSAMHTLDRFLVFLHEVGHLFARDHGKSGPFRLRKRPGTEEAANLLACQLIAEIVDLEPEERMALIRVFRDRYNEVNAQAFKVGDRTRFKPDLKRFERIVARLS